MATAVEPGPSQRGSHQGQVGPQPLGASPDRHRAGEVHHLVGQRCAGGPGRGDPPPQLGISLAHMVWFDQADGSGYLLTRGGKWLVAVQLAAAGLHAVSDLDRGPHLGGEPEPIEKLRAQLTFLGVHGRHQHEPGWVLGREGLALYPVDARGSDVELVIC